MISQRAGGMILLRRHARSSREARHFHRATLLKREASFGSLDVPREGQELEALPSRGFLKEPLHPPSSPPYGPTGRPKTESEICSFLVTVLQQKIQHHILELSVQM